MLQASLSLMSVIDRKIALNGHYFAIIVGHCVPAKWINLPKANSLQLDN